MKKSSLVFHCHVECVFNKDIKNLNFLLFLDIIIFVNTLDLDENQITFHDKFFQKTIEFQKVHKLFLVTVHTPKVHSNTTLFYKSCL